MTKSFLLLDQIDVNVHPAKQIVAFLNENAIFELLQTAVEEVLRECNQTKSCPSASVVRQGYYTVVL